MSDVMRKTPKLLDPEALTRRLEDDGLDAVIAMAPSNVWYLTGHARVFGSGQRPGYAAATLAVATKRGDPVLVVSRWHAGIAQALAWTGNIVQFRNYAESAFITAARVIEEQGLAAGIIGLETSYVPDGDYRDLVAALPEATFLDLGATIADLRARKSPEQLQRSADGYERLARAVTAGLEPTVEGESRLAVHRRIMRRLLEQGTDTGVGGIGAPHERIVPLVSTDAVPIRHGDVLTLDYMCTFGPYAARLSRTAFVGYVPAGSREQYVKQRSALLAAVDRLEPGMATSRAWRHVVDSLEAAGLECRSAAVGHGIGHAFEDLPVLSPRSEHRLEPGMDLVLDPRTSSGLLLSQRLVVTDEGVEASDTGFPSDAPYVIHAGGAPNPTREAANN